MEAFTPELIGLLSLALIVLGTLAVVFYHKAIKPRVLSSDFYKRYGMVLAALDSVVTDTVMRVAFAKEDLSDFEAEAEETGRDVRLVAAIYLIDRFTSDLGIELDEELIVSKIEAKLVQLKDDGVIE